MTSLTVSSSSLALRPHPHLYQINTWAWLEKLSERLGRNIKVADVPDAEWDSVASSGFDIVWLMGVWQRSPESRRITLVEPANLPVFDRTLPGWKPSDVVGSPYAVAQYEPDTRIGTWDALDRVREKLHARGKALFLDFVGNHTALDHPWTQNHPEFYVQGTQQDFEKNPSGFHLTETRMGTYFLAHGKDPFSPPWRDTLQLNHFQPAMRAAQLADLRTIANHCDGVRCDMAMLHLNDIFAKTWGSLLNNVIPPKTEFWTDAHAALPGFVLLAEAYWGTERRLLDLGFSFAYDKGLYDAVRGINMAEVHTRLGDTPAFQRHLARFLENHDEARCATVFGNQRLPAVGALMGTLPGMRFYHQGELEGLKLHLPITLRMAMDEPPDPITSAFFQRILYITNQDVFHVGQWNLLVIKPEDDATSENLVAYEWRSEKSWKVVVVNLSGTAAQGRVYLGDRTSSTKAYIFYDELNDVRYSRSGNELHDLGLYVRREGFQAHLFDVTPI
jgi:hypothetical protein